MKFVFEDSTFNVPQGDTETKGGDNM